MRAHTHTRNKTHFKYKIWEVPAVHKIHFYAINFTFHVCRIQSITTIAELNDVSNGVTNCHIILQT